VPGKSLPAMELAGPSSLPAWPCRQGHLWVLNLGLLDALLDLSKSGPLGLSIFGKPCLEFWSWQSFSNPYLAGKLLLVCA
jgi:hypothetical protein